jgi:Flp pilus assembly protein TadD
MDGRRIRAWCLSGCLVAGALGCESTRNNTNVPPFFSDAKPLTGMPVASKGKSFWSGFGNKPAAPSVDVPEVDYTAQAKPETHALLANAQVEAAFNEDTPSAGRDALLDHARQGYQKALKMDPTNKVALLGLAKFYVRSGDRERAIETYKRYFAAYPKDKDVAHEVALAHAQWKDWAGATAWCEFALKIDPENLSVRKTMAFCLARAGKWEDGFAVMCQVMPEAQARYLMARVLEHQGQPDASRLQLQLAIKADPTHVAAREFLTELDQVTRPASIPNQNPVITVGGTEPIQ